MRCEFFRDHGVVNAVRSDPPRIPMLANIAFTSFSRGTTPRQGRLRSLRGSQCFKTVGMNYSGPTWFRNVAVAIPHTVTELPVVISSGITALQMVGVVNSSGDYNSV